MVGVVMFFFCKTWLQVMPYLMHLSEVWYQFPSSNFKTCPLTSTKEELTCEKFAEEVHKGGNVFVFSEKLDNFQWLSICDYKSFTRMVLNRQGHNWEESRINAEDLIVLPDKTADYWQDGSKKMNLHMMNNCNDSYSCFTKRESLVGANNVKHC